LAEIECALEARLVYQTAAASENGELSRVSFRAMLFSLVAIGEAVKGLSDPLRSAHPEIPWTRIAGMRDVLAHDYYVIDEALVLRTVDESLPQLREWCLQQAGT
jgi:uncharacterized protein with HEPN domain